MHTIVNIINPSSKPNTLIMVVKTKDCLFKLVEFTRVVGGVKVCILPYVFTNIKFSDDEHVGSSKINTPERMLLKFIPNSDLLDLADSTEFNIYISKWYLDEL